jgi:hypothetical protein
MARTLEPAVPCSIGEKTLIRVQNSSSTFFGAGGTPAPQPEAMIASIVVQASGLPACRHLRCQRISKEVFKCLQLNLILIRLLFPYSG